MVLHYNIFFGFLLNILVLCSTNGPLVILILGLQLVQMLGTLLCGKLALVKDWF